MASENDFSIYVGRRLTDQFWYTDLVRGEERLRLYLSHRDDKEAHLRQAWAVAGFIHAELELESDETFAQRVAEVNDRQRRSIQAASGGGGHWINPPPPVPGDPLLAPWQVEKMDEQLKSLKHHG